MLITDGRWSKRVWGHVEKLDETINKALRDGIAAGASSDVIAKRVQARTGVAMSRCRTLVHTECCYVTESATLDRYIAADVKQYGYLATLDKKTCSGFGGHSCGALDGQVFDVRDAQAGVNYPPMHPNCRCTTYAVFDDGSDEEADFYRIARDEKGKNYHVSAKTTYREWKKNGKTEWEKTTVAKTADSGIIKTRDISDRRMANGLRTSPFHILTEKEISSIKADAESLGIPEDIMVFNEGSRTGFSEDLNLIHIRGDVLPDLGSTNTRDRLSPKAVLAHEYYGHYKNNPSAFDIGDWRDEFRASYRAAIDAPNLSDEERRMLMLDAYDRAKEAGVSVKYNRQARRLIYGYED